jgi:AcrR family transcriptional regulator
MARRADHTREELKNLILEAAWKITGAEGFEGLTARRIAAEIGYAPGTIYNIFESMDDLYLQICGRTLDRLYEVLGSPECNNPRHDPLRNMKTMAALYMKFAREYRPYWLMLFSHRMPESRKTDPAHQEKVDRLFEPLEGLLQSYFSPRQERKRKMAARVLWSSVHGLCFLQETGKIEVVGGKADITAEMSSYLIETFVAGVKTGN